MAAERHRPQPDVPLLGLQPAAQHGWREGDAAAAAQVLRRVRCEAEVIVLGIDIGVSGALVALDAHGTAAISDLPTMEIAGQRVVRRKVCAAGLRDLIRHYVPPGESAMALIEDVHMGMGKGGAARSSLDLNRGRVEAVLELMRLQVRVVQPPTWKRHFGLLRTEKAQSLERARGLYPQVAHMLKRQKDHNRAEALLIAHYGRTVLA